MLPVDGDALSAPQGDAGGQALALAALRLDWGPAYALGCDEEIGWWASRHGRAGHLLTADGPDGLRREIAGDYSQGVPP